MKVLPSKLLILLLFSSFTTLATESNSSKISINIPHHNYPYSNLLQVGTDIPSYEKEGFTIYTDLTELKKIDRRKVKTESSPAVLDAVGRIIVSHADEKNENTCSGSLIATTPGQSSRVINSAGHCFGETKTGALIDIKSIKWLTTTKSGKRVEKLLKLEAYNLKQDAAILSFDEKIPFSEIKPILIENEVTMSPSDIIFYNKQSVIISAGYSSDDYKGQDGAVLTYDDGISNKDFTDGLGTYGDYFSMNTVVFSGASGGALLMLTDLSEEDIVNPYNQFYLVGTTLSISGKGNKAFGFSDKSTIGSSHTIYRSYTTTDAQIVDKLNN